MKIEIVERNYDVGKRLQSLIEKKLKKLERYFPDDAKATVVCRQEKKNYIMEVSITNKNGFYRSEVTGENMFENLDMALPKVENKSFVQIKKDKISKHKLKHQFLNFCKNFQLLKTSVLQRRNKFTLIRLTLKMQNICLKQPTTISMHS